MAAHNDAEKVGIEIMGRFGTNIVSVVAAWSFAVVDIISGLGGQMIKEQFELAVEVFERWGMALPGKIMEGDPPKIWMVSEVPVLKKYFSDTLPVFRRVDERRKNWRHLSRDTDRDDIVIKEAREYCEKMLSEIDRFAAMGDLHCESFVFGNLVCHCRDVMRVVLGDKLMDEFNAEYEIAMKSLKNAHDLVNAPEI